MPVHFAFATLEQEELARTFCAPDEADRVVVVSPHLFIFVVHLVELVFVLVLVLCIFISAFLLGLLGPRRGFVDQELGLLELVALPPVVDVPLDGAGVIKIFSKSLAG